MDPYPEVMARAPEVRLAGIPVRFEPVFFVIIVLLGLIMLIRYLIHRDDLRPDPTVAEAAATRIAAIRARGREPLVVGGSTLYVEALLHGLADVPETSEATREALMERLRREGAARLFGELQRIDPASAATMDPTKSQRIVRALEVYEDTGRPLSSYHEHRPRPLFSFDPVVLTRPRDVLYDRINRRVDAMLAAGLIEENRALLAAGHAPTLNPLRTIGYREPMAYLRGEIGYDEMVRRLKQNTRRYAKRQLTWFRRHSGYRWLDLEAGHGVEEFFELQ